MVKKSREGIKVNIKREPKVEEPKSDTKGGNDAK